MKVVILPADGDLVIRLFNGSWLKLTEAVHGNGLKNQVQKENTKD